MWIFQQWTCMVWHVELWDMTFGAISICGNYDDVNWSVEVDQMAPASFSAMATDISWRIDWDSDTLCNWARLTRSIEVTQIQYTRLVWFFSRHLPASEQNPVLFLVAERLKLFLDKKLLEAGHQVVVINLFLCFRTILCLQVVALEKFACCIISQKWRQRLARS